MRTKHIRSLRYLGIAILLFTQSLLATEEVYEYSLKNGMQIFVKPDHRAPVVVSQVWYKVGSSSEASGLTGVSHVLEHMMFKGTKKYPSGTFSETIAFNGGRQNAFTSRDVTAYYQLLGADRLDVALKLEADRMRNLTLPEEEFLKELEVVKEERLSRTDDNPEALTFERFNATAFLNSPYHQPVIGWREDLNALKVDDLRQWYDRFYQPNNAFLVVVGDVDPDHVFKRAKKYFGRIKAGEGVTVKPRQETKQHGERRITVNAPAKIPYLLMGYKVPVLKTAEVAWEPYALSVLASVFDGGRSARFSRELVRSQQVATSATAGYSMLGKYSTLFMIDANPAKGRTLADIEKALEEEIQKVKTGLVTEDELQRIKASVIAGEVYERDSIQHQANQIGQLEGVGLDWRLMNDYVANIQAVTAEQIQAVARKYLVTRHRTVAILQPESLEVASEDAVVQAGAGS